MLLKGLASAPREERLITGIKYHGNRPYPNSFVVLCVKQSCLYLFSLPLPVSIAFLKRDSFFYCPWMYQQATAYQWPGSSERLCPALLALRAPQQANSEGQAGFVSGTQCWILLLKPFKGACFEVFCFSGVANSLILEALPIPVGKAKLVFP